MNSFLAAKDETRLLLLYDCFLVKLHAPVLIHITSVVKLVHTFMASSRASKSYNTYIYFLHRY